MDTIQFKFKPDYTTYANPNRLFSNDWANFFIWIGGRGIGKTTGISFYCLNRYINRGEEFVYVRRYVEELKYAKEFVTPIANNIKMRSIGKAMLEYTFNGKRIGRCCALSSQQKFKSGVDFSKVTTLVFDEAILMNGARYLPNEIEAYFLELVSTVFRQRTNYKVVIIGNNANIFNPYFEYFGVKKFDNIYKDKDKLLYCEKSKNSAQLMEIEKDSPLYRLTKGTSYAEYHYDNQAMVLYEGRVDSKPRDCDLIVRLLYEGRTLNVYYSAEQDVIYVEFKEKEIKDKFSFEIYKKGSVNYLGRRLLSKTDAYMMLEVCFYNDQIIYDNKETVAVMNEVMDLL